MGKFSFLAFELKRTTYESDGLFANDSRRRPERRVHLDDADDGRAAADQLGLDPPFDDLVARNERGRDPNAGLEPDRIVVDDLEVEAAP